LEDLTPDIVIQVLALCGVHATLSFSRASKALRVSAMTKQLWLKILDNLAFNGLLDLPPIDRLNISTDALILLVQRGVAGPAFWLSSFPPNRPERQLTFLEVSEIVDLHLFGGGQYARICNVNSLKIYHVGTGQEIFSYPMDHEHILWSTELLAGGQTLRVFLIP
ncbi:hypothetical protein R3P38DRAFT_2370828, partial [Favolaschia claudopus]